jgi:hypothetical protein
VESVNWSELQQIILKAEAEPTPETPCISHVDLHQITDDVKRNREIYMYKIRILFVTANMKLFL